MRFVLPATVCLGLLAPLSFSQTSNNMANMQAMAQGLGVKCEFCHSGRREPGAVTAPNSPPPKLEIARSMMAMTSDLNAKIAASTGKPPDQLTRVTCITCHRGVTIPGQLSDIVYQTALREGPETATAKYRELRQLYYGRQSYDFGEDTLLTAAQQLAYRKPDDSITLLKLNLEFYPQSVRSYTQMAFAATRKLDDPAAMGYLEKALEIEPQNNMVRGQLEQLKSYQKNRKPAPPR